MDLDNLETSLQKAYEEQIKGAAVTSGDINSNTKEVIQPSDIPDQLVVVTPQELLSKQITFTPREEIPAVFRKRARSEDSSEDDEEKRSWKREKSAKDEPVSQQETQKKVDMFAIPSDQEEDDERPVAIKKNKNAVCPIRGCDWTKRKLRAHVNTHHLPRIMWDSHSTPIRPELYHELNNIRAKVLRFLAKELTGSESLTELLAWCERQRFVPCRAVVLARHIEQMRSLTATMNLSRPGYNRYQLVPPNHVSVLIHWRYQIGMLQHLTGEAINTYLEFGKEFMMNPNNFLYRRRKHRPLCVPNVVPAPETDWDESVVQEEEQESRRIVVMDSCGEPDSCPLMSEEEEDTPEPEELTRTVVIGSSNYTLVLRGSSLSINSNHRRASTTVDPSYVERPRQIEEAWDVYDSHCHLDRTSKRLLYDTSLSMGRWMDETMERPPTVPVNVVGSTLIYCDPETFPQTVPIEDKWKVAVGVHPKKISSLSGEQYHQFTELIQSSRVVAVGEVGLDRTVNEKEWDDQLLFLDQISPLINSLGKPVIFHVRSSRQDHYSTLLYFRLLQFLATRLNKNQKIILHCFSGIEEVQNAWLQQFPNTFFGFTYLSAKFDGKQKAALNSIPVDRLLIETDSPYITPRGISTNSPRYLGEVAEVVARIRRTSLERVCRSTTINALALFQ